VIHLNSFLRKIINKKVMNSTDTLKWHIRNQDKPLINAAIQLGEYIKNYTQTTPAQKQTISQIQNCLKNLPNYTPGISAGYELNIVNNPGFLEMGIRRSWSVEIFNDSIEIMSEYDSFPEPEDRFENAGIELNFCLIAGKERNNDQTNYLRWIIETSNPDLFLTNGYHAEIEVTQKTRQIMVA
jgi:hypothetical protein